jgi:hypothetical protein
MGFSGRSGGRGTPNVSTTTPRTSSGFHGYAPGFTPAKNTGNTSTGTVSATTSSVAAKPTTASKPSNIEVRRSQSNKVATSNLFIVDERTVTVEEMTDLLFEDFGATELINLSRHDSLNGQNIIYQPIKNLSSLALDYNPQNILSFGQTENDLIQNFLLNVEKYIPSEPLVADGITKALADDGRIVYLDQTTNDIIIEVVDIAEDERVEVEFLTYATVEDDTIYIT